MTRALLTGFEPFGPYPINPTADLAKLYDNKLVEGVEVCGLVLPATYHSASQCLWEAIERCKPERVICFGLASRVPKFRIEAYGRNLMTSRYADASGLLSSGDRIEIEGPESVRVNSDPLDLAAHLHEAGIPSEISVNADGFICNALIYETMRLLESEASPSFVFIHIPWPDCYIDRIELDAGKVTVPWSMLTRAAEIALTYPLNR